jgi:hypothetical protein
MSLYYTRLNNPLWLYADYTLDNYPGALNLSGGFNNPNSAIFNDGPGAPDLTDLTAANGFQMDLTPGISDFTDFAGWNASPVTAYETPEPGTNCLLLCGLALFGSVGRRRNR